MRVWKIWLWCFRNNKGIMRFKNFARTAFKKLTNSPMRVIVLSFAVAIFFGAFLLSLPIAHNNGEWFPFIDALFTSTSALCVTGLIAVDTATAFNGFGQAVILLLIQLGGLGVMTGATLITIAIGKRISLKGRLLMQESFSQNRLQGIIKLIKQIFFFTFLTELVGAIILACSFIPRYGASGIWPSIFISISSYCNAGFDVLGLLEKPFGSLTPFVSNIFVILPISMLIIIGGLGYGVVRDVGNVFRKKRMSLHAKMVLIATSILLAVGWIFFTAVEWNNTLAGLSPFGKIVAGLFQSVAPRTAGFNSIDQAAMTPASYLMTLIFMFIGASPASTGGGIKTTTFTCLILIVVATVRGEHEVNIGKSKLNNMAIRKIITTVSIAIMCVLTATVLISAIEVNKDISLSKIVFECVSAFGTVGLSMGITPYLSAWSKLILGIVMFVGRVGPLTLGASIAKSYRDNKKVEYMDAKIIVG